MNRIDRLVATVLLLQSRHVVRAKDIGKAVAFFASDDAINITGQSLNVNGGTRMN